MKMYSDSVKNILVIDDMKLNYLIIKKTFSKNINWTVYHVQDPRETSAFLKAHSIDLILLDYEMPHVNGPEVCEMIKSDPDSMHIPVIFSTATSAQSTIERAFAAGADDYINKPICIPELFARINRMFQSQDLKKEIEIKYQEQVSLTRVLSHDLSNYVSIINNSALALERALVLNEVENKAISRIKKTCQRMDDLVVNIRKMQAIEDNKIEIKNEKVYIFETLKESISNFQEKLEAKNITVEFINQENFNQNSPLVWSEKTTVLNSVFGNIISNAIKFSHKGEKIQIQAEEVVNDIIISIRDFGVGMDEELSKKVFNKNSKTSRLGTDNESGTGFGMPLVKSFMEKYGGKVEVQSKAASEGQDEHGTVVQLYFKKVA